jgi:protein-disulfide isomerase
MIIGEDSLPAGAAAIAAGNQGKGWTFLELFYRNQGKENSGYVTDEFIEAVAKASGVKDMAKFNEERKSKVVEKEAERTTEQAGTLGFGGTPSFAVQGPSSNGLELVEEGATTGDIEGRIAEAS